MATGNDWDTRKARVTEQIEIQIPALISNYEMKTRSVGDLITQMEKLENEKGKLQHEISMAEQDAGTADREFIERRQTFLIPSNPPKSIQSKTLHFICFLSAILSF